MLLPSLAALALAIAPQEGGFGRAPDGRPGFGARPDPRALEVLFRKPDADGDAWLLDLYTLATDVDVLAAAARRRYEGLGYFEALGPSTRAACRASVPELIARFRLIERTPFQQARASSEALAIGRMLLDDAFRMRIAPLEAVAEESRELRSALRLFEGHAFGRVGLESGPLLDAIAQRADLAAARLRALRLDLEALHEPVVGGLEVEVPEALLDALRAGDAVWGMRLLRGLEAGGRGRRERMQASLFTPRFDKGAGDLLADRDRGRQEAVASLREMMRLLPFTAGENADLAGDLKVSERHRLAAEAGRRALQGDPFADSGHYLMGIASEFLAVEPSMRHFDRYLVLRSIRHWDQGTFASRELNASERYALWVVAAWRPSTSAAGD